MTTQVAVHIIEHRGASGLGVSRTPRAWRAKSSKTLTADDNNFIVMQRLGYESPSRGSKATRTVCAYLHAKTIQYVAYTSPRSSLRRRRELPQK